MGEEEAVMLLAAYLQDEKKVDEYTAIATATEYVERFFKESERG